MSRQRRPRRAPNPDAQFDALYARVPAIDCRGACADTCTHFPVTRAEKRRIAARTGGPTPDEHPAAWKPPCPLLTWAGQCAVYDIRPLLCRLWGASELFPCNYGCRPEGGHLLGIKETYMLMAEAYEISGQPGRAVELRRILQVPDDVVAAKAPLLKAMAWGRIDYAEAYRRAYPPQSAGG